MGIKANRLRSAAAGDDDMAGQVRHVADTRPDASQLLVDQARRLTGQIDRLVAGEHEKAHFERELERMHAQALQLVDQLEALVAAESLPLDHEGERAAMAADKVMKHVALAYLEVAQDAAKRPLGINFKLALRRDTQRGIELSARRVRLACRLKRAPSYANWRVM
ncbi:MAG: hypothetical protein JNJ60_08080, partial [Rhodocyclaceae bacterium]|nr:hypothetical protein [Rhodocyclaceae bacterium]